MHKLSMGANAALTTQQFEVAIEWPANAGTLDCSAYLLTESGKVRGDADMIFYNQPEDVSGSVRITLLEQGRCHFHFDLAAIPTAIERIVVCATIEEVGRKMSTFQGTSAMIRANGEAVLGFAPDLRDAREVALRMIEVYRRNGTWKLRADGQGFNDGLAPLARSFGIDVAEDEPSPTKDTNSTTPPPPTPSVRGHAPEIAPVVPVGNETRDSRPVADDGSIRLDAVRPSHTWQFAPSNHPGQISLALKWSSESGSLNGRPRPLELALGCLYELADGRRGAIQAWDTNGAYDRAPYIELVSTNSGDKNGRKLLVNGEHLHRMKRLAVYAFIPFEAPNWKGASLTLEFVAAGLAPVSLTIDHARDGFGLVGLANLASSSSGLDIARSGQAYLGHQEFDHGLGWNLTWRTASPIG